MALITLQAVKYGFGEPALLDAVDLNIENGERLGLIGRNGEGKTTLLKIIKGEILLDEGRIDRQSGIRIAYLPQDIPEDLSGTVEQAVLRGQPSKDPQLKDAPWLLHQKSAETLSRLDLDPSLEVEQLSVGLKRRVLLAKALVQDPELLLLDEPTNHLDIASIEWLEDFLLRWKKSLMFISHDRRFLKKLSTRIVEVDRGTLFNWNCDYDTFLKRKEAYLESESKQISEFDRKMAREQNWARGGIKARRRRNEGRVRRLEEMRQLRQQRRDRLPEIHFQIQEAERTGKLVLKAENVNFAYESRTILRDFSTVILRGDKVGILGSNGSGKSTLLHLLCGDLHPQTGKISRGANVNIAYFDQLREQLDENRTVMENVCDGRELFDINGKTRHVYGYLKEFLFTPERVRTPVSVLSGGEKNRLLLARLFAVPTNLLVLDEPTNDLDAETLELLEQRLVEYEGTLLLVSHDREFLNHVVISTLVVESDGRVKEYVGGYDDYVRQRQGASEKQREVPVKKDTLSRTRAFRSRKLTYREKQELDTIPQHIEQLEAEIGQLYAGMSDPEHYMKDPRKIVRDQKRLQDVEKSLTDAYTRWEELEVIASGNAS